MTQKCFWFELFWHSIHYLWSNNPMWYHAIWATLVQLMVCCLMAPSLYLNHFLLIITYVLWHPLISQEMLMKLMLHMYSEITVKQMLIKNVSNPSHWQPTLVGPGHRVEEYIHFMISTTAFMQGFFHYHCCGNDKCLTWDQPIRWNAWVPLQIAVGSQYIGMWVI